MESAESEASTLEGLAGSSVVTAATATIADPEAAAGAGKKFAAGGIATRKVYL